MTQNNTMPSIGAMDLSAYAVDSRWLRTDPASHTILIVYAHPDDESFANAGTILRYSSAGVAVHYACATRGECGSVDPALLAGHADIGALREQELLCAAQVLGLSGVHFLGYRDSGMAGAPENQHPAALAQAPLERVAGQVVALMRVLRPQVVITFNPYGGYGHPDHIAIHHATHAAFAAASDPTRYPEHIAAGLTPWTPNKLYYSTFGGRMIKISVAMMRLLGRDPRRYGQNGDIDLARVIAEITPLTTTIGSGAYLERKERAWACHRSQLGGMTMVRRMPAILRRLWMSTEHFTRIEPPWNGRRRERDLLAGIELNQTAQ